MQKIASNREPVYIGAAISIATAIGLAFAATHLIGAGNPIGALLTSALCGLLLTALAGSELSCDVCVSSTHIWIDITFPTQKLSLTANKSDVFEIIYESGGHGEGVFSQALVDIQGVGKISLSHWDFEQTKALGQALGMSVKEMAVTWKSPATYLQNLL